MTLNVVRRDMKNLYFDHAAATPLDPRVAGAMEPYFADEFVGRRVFCVRPMHPLVVGAEKRYAGGRMQLEHASATDLKKAIRHIVAKHLSPNQYRVFFFGSRVNGTGSERSDIDIGIAGDEAVPAGALARIREELDELPVLYRIDVVDFARVSPRFRKEALKHNESIYESRR